MWQNHSNAQDSWSCM